MEKLILKPSEIANTYVTQSYILDDLDMPFSQDLDAPVYHVNEISLLKDKSLSPELKERLGLIMSDRSHVVSPDNVSRYMQSLSERRAAVAAALDALDKETADYEAFKKEVEESDRKDKADLLARLEAFEAAQQQEGGK